MKPLVFNYQHYEFSIGVLKKIDEILKDQSKLWLSFIYAIPVSGIVLLVFSCIWGNNIYRFLFTSLIVWTSSLSVHLTMNLFNVQNGYMLYFISIVLEIMAFVFFIILKKNKKN